MSPFGPTVNNQIAYTSIFIISKILFLKLFTKGKGRLLDALCQLD